MRRVCYAGTYERDYPRNLLVIQALRDAGVRVEEAHAPVFERVRDKGAMSPLSMVVLLLRVMLAYLRLVPEVALRLLRCDTLAVGYIGQLDMLVLAPVARLMRRRVMFNPLVSLTDTLIEDRGRFNAAGPVARVVRAIDRAALRQADVLLADTDENAAYLERLAGLGQDRVATVQVGADEELFFAAGRPTDSDEVLDVLFVGKFIPLHGVETILRAAARLQERAAPVRIEMVGAGQEYGDARRLAEKLDLRNVCWTDWIAYERLGERIRAADVALGIFDAGPKAGRVIPNKVHQSLACGTAVVTRQSPAVDGYLTDGESALLVPPADPEALADAIEALLDRDVRERVADGGRIAWEQWGARVSLATQMTDALQRLARTP